MDKFLGTWEVPKISQQSTENQNKSTTSNDIEVTMVFQQRKTQEWKDLLLISIMLQKELTPISLNYYKNYYRKLKGEEHFQTHFTKP